MRSGRVVTTLVLALALAGCSGSDAASPGAPAAATPATPPASPPGAPVTSAAAPVAETLGPVTGTRTITGSASTARDNPVSVRLDLHGLHRDGRLLRLDYSVTSLATTDERFYVPDLVSTINVNEIVLLDTTRLKRYLVVEDSASTRLFTPPNVYLVDGQRFEGAAYFAAPPPDVTELELVFASYGRYTTPITG